MSVCAAHTDTQFEHRIQEAFPGMAALGLRMQTVKGDGNCLFRSFAVLAPHLNYKQWRQELVDRLEELVKAEPHKEQYHLGSGNAGLEDLLWEEEVNKNGKRVRKQKLYSTFKHLMEDMRNNQWGYSDFITEFSLRMKVAVVNFVPGGRPVYNRHESLDKVKDTVFLVNLADDQGMCAIVC